MFSVRLVNTAVAEDLIEQIKTEAQNGLIEIEVPKYGVLFFNEIEVIKRDYLQAAYALYLLSEFNLIDLYIPAINEHNSFTFKVQTEDNDNFYIILANSLVQISAGYENESLDEMAPIEFYDDAVELFENWKNGIIDTNDSILQECRTLLEHWPTENDEDEFQD